MKNDTIPQASSAFMYTLNVGEIEKTPEIIKEFIRNSRPENMDTSARPSTRRPEISHRLNVRISHFYNKNESMPEISLSPVRVSLAEIPVPGIFVHSSSPAYMIIYTTSGRGAIVFHDQRFYFRKNEGIIINCQDLQQYYADPQTGWECVFLRIEGALAQKIYEHADHTNRYKFSFFDSGHFQALLRELLHPSDSPYADQTSHAVLIITEILSEIALELARFENRLRDVPPHIEEIRQYLEQHLSEEITLDTLADTFSFSKYHLSREFKKYMGRPPIDYLLECRLTRAKSLLANTKQSIADISHAVGIENSNYFFTLFNKKEGMSPSAFRKQFFEHQAKSLGEE